jgi:hypothetical protein
MNSNSQALGHKPDKSTGSSKLQYEPTKYISTHSKMYPLSQFSAPQVQSLAKETTHTSP